MANKHDTTAWMWLDNGEVRGLSIDVDAKELWWQSRLGCHCGDEDAYVQPLDAYRQHGAPAVVGRLPDDIDEEVRAVVAGL